MIIDPFSFDLLARGVENQVRQLRENTGDGFQFGSRRGCDA
jgi:hypothetical protein